MTVSSRLKADNILRVVIAEEEEKENEEETTIWNFVEKEKQKFLFSLILLFRVYFT